jgi:hypothetical protein
LHEIGEAIGDYKGRLKYYVSQGKSIPMAKYLVNQEIVKNIEMPALKELGEPFRENYEDWTKENNIGIVPDPTMHTDVKTGKVIKWEGL